MSDNVYETPSSELVTEETGGSINDFYVVSLKKFNILFFATFSIYAVYWFYKNWKLVKIREKRDIWPVARGIFSIFFTHSLFSLIEGRVEQAGEKKWNGGQLATLYVVVTLISIFMGYGSNTFIYLLSFALIIPVWYPLYSAQYKINVICGDPKGESNSEFSAANYIFIGLGVIFWLFALLGAFIPA